MSHQYYPGPSSNLYQVQQDTAAMLHQAYTLLSSSGGYPATTAGGVPPMQVYPPASQSQRHADFEQGAPQFLRLPPGASVFGLPPQLGYWPANTPVHHAAQLGPPSAPMATGVAAQHALPPASLPLRPPSTAPAPGIFLSTPRPSLSYPTPPGSPIPGCQCL